ncbi:MAG: aminotransferase class V-fold PLP-dependent enzyme [Verrucomicrobiae bacterium]|nr:aminotransferase class V-fold PLP-dependent enzyme [Verrucomicrobiae bacterium]
MNQKDDAFWLLDPNVTYLNHGSFGSCPRPVLDFQHSLRERLEKNAMQFLVRELEGMLDSARAALAAFVGAKPDDLVFVANATTGVNAVLRSLTWKPGDELLTTNHVYNACGNALDFAAERNGARVVVADVPFPLDDEQQVVDAVGAAVTERTRLALIDHVTSETGIVLPIDRLIPLLQERGIEVLIDGAHAPGMVALNLDALGADYYTGNCHKWICAPKGAGFLHVKPEKQGAIRPLAISHGANSDRTDRSRFQIEFGWTGTSDPTAFLSVPEALRVMAARHSGGWAGLMKANHERVIDARRVLCEALRIVPPCPESMLGSLASIPLPDAVTIEPSLPPLALDPFQDRLAHRYAIEVPVFPWPQPSRRLLRVSSQDYNSQEDYRRLADVLRDIVGSDDGCRASASGC